MGLSVRVKSPSVYL